MKHPTSEFTVLDTVTDYNRLCSLPPPAHPLLGLIDFVETRHNPRPPVSKVVQQFYTIWLKKGLKGRLPYGNQSYDFKEGVFGFQAPGQMFIIDESLDISELTGWMLVLHPDFLVKYPLGQKMATYGFFSYAVHEALHLSAGEEAMLNRHVESIRAEYERPIDAFSQDVLVSQLEVLLNYANRFYHRQFLTRRSVENDLLTRFTERLTAYFALETDATTGGLPLPTVQFFADELTVSPAYLGDMLRTLTGQTTQQHIHHALIEKAKQLLLTTSLSVNETAFRLGFAYPQYFSRLFKSKTGLSPAAFRVSAQ